MTGKRFFIVLLFLLLSPGLLSADIWKIHVNSNRCDQLLGNEKELWVRSMGGGLVRWDLTTGEYTRYYTRGLPTNSINGMCYDDECRLLIIESEENFLRYEKGVFNQITSLRYCESFTYYDGFLYASSDKGLFKWDGEKWEEIPQLSDYEIREISPAPDGSLWMATAASSPADPVQLDPMVLNYKDGILIFFTREGVGGPKYYDSGFGFSEIYVDSSGTVWVGLKGGIAWYDGNSWRQFYWVDELKFLTPYTAGIVEDKDGIIWVAGGKDGLIRFSGEEGTLVEAYKDENVLSVESAPVGGLWVGTPDCLEHFDGSQRKPYKIANLLPINNFIADIDLSPKGVIWCGDNYGDLALFERNSWKAFHGAQISSTGFETLGQLNAIKISENSGVWTIFDRDVLNYVGNIWIDHYDPLVPEMGIFFESIAEAPNGDIWIGNQKDKLARWDGSKWEFFLIKSEDPIPSGSARDMTFDQEENLWVVDGNGVWVWNGKEWFCYFELDYPELKRLYPVTIKAMSDGTIWVGGQYGILIFSDWKIIRKFTGEDGLPSNSYGGIGIVDIEEAPDGTVWLLSDVSGLIHFNGTRFSVRYHNLGKDLFSGYKSFKIDRSGRSFIASSCGITEFIPTSVTLKMNLFADKVMYDAGDELTLSLMVNNYGPDETGDLYFVMVSPEGKVYSAPEWSESVHPAASDITIPEGFRMPMMPVLTLRLPSGAPPISAPGQYLFAVALADPSTTYFRNKTVTTIEVK